MGFVLAVPGRYVQGFGVIHDVGKYVSPLGARALLIGGPTALSVSQGAIASSLEPENVGWVAHRFRGECTRGEIERLNF